jgi:hypothetical protein
MIDKIKNFLKDFIEEKLIQESFIEKVKNEID